MKHFITTALFFAAVASFAQEPLKLTAEGIPAQVVIIEGKTAADLYTKTKEWINKHYVNPKEVLKAEIENNMVRLSGYCQDCCEQKGLVKVYFDFNYTIEIEFKDGKYRYSCSVTELSDDGKAVMLNPGHFFKKDGSPRGMYDRSIETIEASVNETYSSLYKYLTGVTQINNSEW